MALNHMFTEMQRQLASAHAGAAQFADYQAAWEAAMRSKTSGTPIPCPLCFVERKLNRMAPVPRDDGRGAGKCQGCGTEFYWPGN